MLSALLLLALMMLLSAGCITSVAQSSAGPQPYTGPSIADVIAANATPLPTRIPASPMTIGAAPVPAATIPVPAADLRGLALRVEDFPAGFQQMRELVMPNADFANLSGEPTKAFGLMESSGRTGGFVNIFARAGAEGTHAFPLITASLSRYSDPARMGDAWSAYEEVSLQYPPLPYLKTEKIDAPKLGDQSGAMRLSQKNSADQTMVLHWTYFRHGTIIADVTTVASEAQADKGELSAALATKLFERVSARPR